MKAILISFLLVINQPDGLTTTQAIRAGRIAVRKLNTLTPYRFIYKGVKTVEDPFPKTLDGVSRLKNWNAFVKETKTDSTYVHVFDAWTDKRFKGLAYQCQPLKNKKQVSITMPLAVEKGVDTSLFAGVSAAHEIGHQIGFPHVGFEGEEEKISIMDEFLSVYRFITNIKNFIFYDKVKDLKELGCKVNFK